MTTSFDPDTLVQAATQLAVVRMYATSVDEQVGDCLLEVCAGYATTEKPRYFRLSAAVNFANLADSRDAQLGRWDVNEIPSAPDELANYFAGWLTSDESAGRGWITDYPVTCTLTKDGELKTYGSTAEPFIWMLFMVHQRIASGMGPNTPHATSFVFRRLSEFMITAANLNLKPSRLKVK